MAARDKVTGTPKPDPKKLSPKDRNNTIVHLAETIKYNSEHSLNHAKTAARLAAKVKGNDNQQTLLHNAQHAAKHAGDVAEHAGKLLEHLRKTYPGAAVAYAELKNPQASAIPSPPGKTRKSAR